MAYKQNKITPFTQKDDKKKTYPKHYTKEDINFLEEQNEDVVREEDKYPEGKKRYFKNMMYKLTGNNKYLQK